MFCVKCGTELPDDSQFCRKCGQPLGSAVATSATGAAAAVAVAPAPMPSPLPVAKPNRRRIAIWFLLPLLALVVWWAVTSNSPGAQQLQGIVKPLHTATLPESRIKLPPLSYHSYKFEIPDGSVNVAMEGRFTANGGSGNDVEVLLLSDNEFVNWQNGHPVRTIYSSGKVTQDTFKVALPSAAGTYYLVFNNKFSLLSEKVVDANATLHFNQ